mgnify:FL=1
MQDRVSDPLAPLASRRFSCGFALGFGPGGGWEETPLTLARSALVLRFCITKTYLATLIFVTPTTNGTESSSTFRCHKICGSPDGEPSLAKRLSPTGRAGRSVRAALVFHGDKEDHAFALRQLDWNDVKLKDATRFAVLA